MSKEKNQRFEEVLLCAIDDAFLSLGEKVKFSLFYCLEHDYLIARREIPYRICDFSNALERIFGIGTRQLELLIMQKLNQKIKASYEWQGPSWLIPDLTFTKYVTLMEIFYNNRGKVDNLEIMVEDGQKQQEKA